MEDKRNLENLGHLEKQAEKKHSARKKKFSKPEMKTSGKSVFALGELMKKSRGQRVIKYLKKTRK